MPFIGAPGDSGDAARAVADVVQNEAEALNSLHIPLKRRHRLLSWLRRLRG